MYRQRITIEPVDSSSGQRQVVVHASHLVPFQQPYAEPDHVELGEDATPPVFEENPEDSPAPAPRRKRTRTRTSANCLSVWELAKIL